MIRIKLDSFVPKSWSIADMHKTLPLTITFLERLLVVESLEGIVPMVKEFLDSFVEAVPEKFEGIDMKEVSALLSAPLVDLLKDTGIDLADVTKYWGVGRVYIRAILMVARGYQQDPYALEELVEVYNQLIKDFDLSLV